MNPENTLRINGKLILMPKKKAVEVHNIPASSVFLAQSGYLLCIYFLTHMNENARITRIQKEIIGKVSFRLGGTIAIPTADSKQKEMTGPVQSKFCGGRGSGLL
ncbi:unnamed protein product [Fraxinus pennsylvanica]|uniref:Uncharacterized protein n=1 Tax=Fraxinus pennsylvanica TaxID=56036 RepID=A0AAD2AFQ9_9LAMI|nr:unnamed protein product [Fraxinus pennsylvanica]